MLDEADKDLGTKAFEAIAAGCMGDAEARPSFFFLLLYLRLRSFLPCFGHRPPLHWQCCRIFLALLPCEVPNVPPLSLPLAGLTLYLNESFASPAPVTATVTAGRGKTRRNSGRAARKSYC